MNVREKYYLKLLEDYPDILTTKDLMTIIGVSYKTVIEKVIP